MPIVGKLGTRKPLPYWGMHETSADLASLQNLLDRSAASAGAHLRRIITPERRLSAEEVCARLTGMRLLALATVTSDGRPLVGPVDGVFYRGAFHFGSSPDSGWESFLASGPVYARIDADRMFTFHMGDGG